MKEGGSRKRLWEDRNNIKEKGRRDSYGIGCERGGEKKKRGGIDRGFVVIGVRSASQWHLTRHCCHADSISPEEIKTTETSMPRIIPDRQ